MSFLFKAKNLRKISLGALFGQGTNVLGGGGEEFLAQWLHLHMPIRAMEDGQRLFSHSSEAAEVEGREEGRQTRGGRVLPGLVRSDTFILVTPKFCSVQRESVSCWTG